MRDKLRDEKYWDEYLEFERELIEIDEGAVTKWSSMEQTADISRYLNSSLSRLEIERKCELIGLYSSGESLDVIREKFIDLVDIAEQIWKSKNNFVYMLWYVSLGVMLDVRGDTLEKLTSMVRKKGRNDKLINFLMNCLDNEWQAGGSYFMKDPYAFLENILQSKDKEEQVALLKEYLEKKWYKAHDEEAWYNLHKSSNDIYYGYWSFESGAIAKVLGLDDSSLKDVKYYPYDLAHYKI